MFLKDNEKQMLIKQFPNPKLSYETIIHKKVYKSDLIFVVPKGNKCFAWFTYFNDEPVCFILELNDQFIITKIFPVNTSFNTDLSAGTILFGTFFKNSNNTFFTIEDIYWYKEKELFKISWHEKMLIINDIMENDIKQIKYNSTFLTFGLPIIHNDINGLLKEIKNTPYAIQSLKFVLYNNYNKYLSLEYKNINNNNNNNNNIKHTPNNITNSNHLSDNKRVFKIKAEIQNDIYSLYSPEDVGNQLNFHSTALVPSYKTSVMLNNLFRTIKENKNLDALEESDDEGDFQNVNVDKFVNLCKVCTMLCIYNNKFKAWVPVKVLNSN
uniref:mRNA capping enzyme adenylation domain-containing protein n=1 Tax=viral metagenome TaxID=1070528 RepID=A0A6C0LM45_9ZZZZ